MTRLWVVNFARLLTVFAIIPYFIVYGNLYSSLSVVIPDLFSRKIIRAVLGVIALIGIPGSIVIFFGLGLNQREILHKLKAKNKDPLVMVFLFSILFYGLRYILLLDELEYIYILIPIFLLFLINTFSNQVFYVLLVFSKILPNFCQIHLFIRDPNTYENTFSIGFSPGAIYQEKRLRLLNEYKANVLPELINQISNQYYNKTVCLEPCNIQKALVIINKEKLRYYRNDHMNGVYNQVFNSQTVIVYNLPSNYGWRMFMAFTDWHKISVQDFSLISSIP